MATISEKIDNQLIHLGARLRHARLTRGLTMAAFAGQLGISVAALRRMEQGRPGVSIGRWAVALQHLNGSGELDGLLSGPGPRTPYAHQNHPRGLRRRTV